MHDVEKTWFDTNAVAGLCILWFRSSLHRTFLYPGMQFLAVQFLPLCSVLPLLLIFFKEPLTNLVEEKSRGYAKRKRHVYRTGYL